MPEHRGRQKGCCGVNDVVSIGGLVLMVFLVNHYVKPIAWEKGNKQIFTQSLLTLANYVLSYLMCVKSCLFASKHELPSFTALLFIVLSIHNFKKSIQVLSPLLRKKVTRDNNTPYLLIVCMEWVSLFGLLCTINYAVYSIFPTWYALPEAHTAAETAFEFVYYTFTLMITYSSDTIQAIHPATKALQIAEMLFFYVAVGIVISQLLGRVAETAFDGTENK